MIAGPTVFLAGFPKCGTTSLHQALRRAGAASTSVKEPGFLMSAGLSDADVRAAYRLSFRHSGEANVRMDATPWYVYDTSLVSRIERMFPLAKILVLTRDPHARAESAYVDQVRNGRERRSYNSAVFDETRLPADAPPVTGYIWGSLFGERLTPWLSAFGPERLRLLDVSQTSAEATRAELGAWLGLPGPVPALGHGNTASSRENLGTYPMVRAVGRVGELVPRRIKPALLNLAQPPLAVISRKGLGRSRPLPDPAKRHLEPDIAQVVSDLFAADSLLFREAAEGNWLGGAPGWLHD